MDIQLISLLSGIITIITGVLSLSKDLSKTKLIRAIKTLCCYSVPILFIQQIFNLTYLFQEVIMLIFIGSLLIVTVCQFDRYSHKKVNNHFINFIKENPRGFIVFIVIILSVILLFVGEYKLRDNLVGQFTINREKFIHTLNTYKINTEMFIFLKDNIFMSACMILDASNILLIFYSIKFLRLNIELDNEYLNMLDKMANNNEKQFLRTSYNVQSNDDFRILQQSIIFFDKALRLSVLSCLISSGLLFWFLEAVIKLF